MPVAVGAAMILTLAGDGHDGFWSNHPMLGALISGGLLFVAGILVVDKFIEHRNARRWAAVSVAANRELGHLIDDILKVMWLAHSEPDPNGSSHNSRSWTSAARACEVRAGHERPERSLRNLAIFDAYLPPSDYSGAALTPVERLKTLFEDAEFAASARALIAEQRDAVRENAKGWAGLMMWADDSQRLLNTLGIFAEENLSAIEYHLACLGNSSPQGHAAAAARLWCVADVKGRALLNTLWGTNTQYHWAMPDRADVSLAQAFRKPDRVGRWRPASDDPFTDMPFELSGVLWRNKAREP